jgi:hypothetical protein
MTIWFGYYRLDSVYRFKKYNGLILGTRICRGFEAQPRSKTLAGDH